MPAQPRKYSARFEGHWGKVADQRVLDVAKAGASDIRGNETVEKYLTRRAKDLLNSRTDADEEGVTELMDVCDSLGFRDCRDDFEWKLRELADKQEALRLAELLPYFGDPEVFFEKLVEEPQGHGLGEGSSVWAVMAQTMRALFDGQFPTMTIHTIAERLEVPDGIVAYLGLHYLEKAGEVTVGSRPGNLPSGIVEVLDAIPTMMQMKRVMIFADRAILPEELDEDAVHTFTFSAVSNYPKILELVDGVLDKTEEASVYYCLAVLKALGANAVGICEVIAQSVSTTPRQAEEIWEAVVPEEVEEDEGEDSGGGEGGTDGQPDDGELVDFIVPGKFIEKAGWDLRADQVICDRNLQTQPLENETCLGILIRLHEKGWPDAAICLLLSRTPAAVQVRLSKQRREVGLNDPTNVQKAQFIGLAVLAKAIQAGKVEKPTTGPNARVDLQNPVPVGGSPTAPPPPPPILHPQNGAVEGRIKPPFTHSIKTMVRALGGLDPVTFYDVLWDVCGLTPEELWTRVRQRELDILKPVDESPVDSNQEG